MVKTVSNEAWINTKEKRNGDVYQREESGDLYLREEEGGSFLYKSDAGGKDGRLRVVGMRYMYDCNWGGGSARICAGLVCRALVRDET